MRKKHHKLTKEQRDEVARIYYEGEKTTQQIGEEFGCSYQNVIKISQARPHIKEMVEQREGN